MTQEALAEAKALVETFIKNNPLDEQDDDQELAQILSNLNSILHSLEFEQTDAKTTLLMLDHFSVQNFPATYKPDVMTQLNKGRLDRKTKFHQEHQDLFREIQKLDLAPKVDAPKVEVTTTADLADQILGTAKPILHSNLAGKTSAEVEAKPEAAAKIKPKQR